MWNFTSHALVSIGMSYYGKIKLIKAFAEFILKTCQIFICFVACNNLLCLILKNLFMKMNNVGSQEGKHILIFLVNFLRVWKIIILFSYKNLNIISKNSFISKIKLYLIHMNNLRQKVNHPKILLKYTQ